MTETRILQGDWQMGQMWKKCIRLALLFSVLLCVLSMTSGCLATSVFHHLAIAPNHKKHEFSNRGPAEARWMTTPVALQGDFLGTEENDGILMNHYQFAGLLEGKDRTVHVFLSATGHDKAFAYEGDRVVSNESKPAWLIINTHPNSPKDSAPLVKDIERRMSPMASGPILGGFVTTYGELCIFNVLDSLNMDTNGRTPDWDVPVSVEWRVRSKAMSWIRPVYAIPAAILCLPVDVVMWVYTPFEMCFTRLEGLTYVNMCESLMDD